MNLNEQQLQAINHYTGNCAVLASAGSGKTTVLTKRIESLIDKYKVNPENILALTFSKKAAENMKNRLTNANNIFIGTFHALGYKILKETRNLSYNALPIKDWEKKKIINEICTKKMHLEYDDSTVEINDILNFISFQKNNILDHNDSLLKVKDMPYGIETMKQIYTYYEKQKNSSNLIDFDDMLLKFYNLLNTNELILDKYQNKFKFILVDEMQDTNKIQYEIIRLLGKANNNVFVVGDPLQCLIPSTLISTPKGKIPISELHNNDDITVAMGRGKKINTKINNVISKKYNGKIIKITTKNGNIIEGTPNHCIFTKQLPYKGLHYVYLMYKKDYGYRIGITSTARSTMKYNNKNGYINGYEGRLTQEQGDSIWILEVCDSIEDAMYYEQYYSYEYGIPQSLFIARSKNGLDQSGIDKLFKSIDTNKNVKRLMNDKMFFEEIPYHRPSGGSERNRINFTMFEHSSLSRCNYFEDRSDKNKQYIHRHGININTTNTNFIKCVEKYIKFNDKTNRKGIEYWRASVNNFNYDHIYNLANNIEDECKKNNVEVKINYSAKITEILYKFTPMSYARKGMLIPIEIDNEIIDDEIIKVENYDYDGLVYDLNVDYYRNYIANGIVVHNCIYEFRLANNNYLIDFYKDWINTKVISLNTNYRSSDNIVKISNKLVEGIKETTHKHYIESKAFNDVYKEPEFKCYNDEFYEADSIVKKIKKDYMNTTCAILTRTNFQIQAIERALYNNNVLYEVIDGKPFYEQKEIKDMIAYLRLINDKNDEAFIQVYNSPNRYLGSVFLNEVQTYAKLKNISLYDSMFAFPRNDEWRYKNGITQIKQIVEKIKNRKRYNVGSLIEIIRNDLNYDKYISKEINDKDTNDKNEKIENLDALVNLAKKFKNISDFLNDVDNILNFSKNNSGNVKLMTIHKSKGLEFPIVFIAGVNQNILPHVKSNNEIEEKRIFYVGLTRAEKELYISSTHFYGDKTMDISDFIYDIFDEEYINKNN